MRAVVTAVIAAIEAAAVALAGMAVVVVPALLLWIFTFDLASEPMSVFSGSLGVWFLAHLVPIGFEITPEIAVGLGLPQQAFDYPLSLAPLGLTCLTAALAVRSGLRFGRRGGTGAAGVFGGMVGFGLVVAAVLPIAAPVLRWPTALSVTVPVLVYGVCAAVGFLVRAAHEEHEWWSRSVRLVQKGIDGLGVPGSAAFPDRAGVVVRLAAAAIASVAVLASVAIVVAIVVHYVQVVTLSQSLQLDPLGALVVFLLQLAMLPVLIVWAASWLTGAGFSLGIGSTVSPFETLLGPVPAVPVFGAIPSGWGSAGMFAPALVVLAGVVVGALFSRRPLLRRASWAAVLAMAAVAAICAGLVFAGAGVIASGGIGPDRLADTGPSPWIFGGLAAAELCAGLMLGLAAGRLDARGLAAALPLQRENSGFSTGIDDADPDARSGTGVEDSRATVPLDEAVKDLRVRSWPRRTRVDAEGVDADDAADDAVDADADAGAGAAAGADAAAAAVDSSVPDAEPDIDDDALLRAFSWDRRDAAADHGRPEPAEPAGRVDEGPMKNAKRRGWPFGRRDG